MKRKFGYLGSENNRESFYKVIKRREVKEGLNDKIEKFKECMEGNKYIGFNCYYEEGEFKLKGEGIYLKNKNIEFFTLLLILCENIEGIGFYNCRVDGEMMKVMSESFVFLKKLKEINLGSKNKIKIDNGLREEGCKAIFNNAKYLSNLEKLNFEWNGITSESSEVINENIRYFKNLREIDLGCKNENKLDNWYFGDGGCKAIFNNAKYLSNLEKLNLENCEVTDESISTIVNNAKYLINLTSLNLQNIYSINKFNEDNKQKMKDEYKYVNTVLF